MRVVLNISWRNAPDSKKINTSSWVWPENCDEVMETVYREKEFLTRVHEPTMELIYEYT